MGLFSGRNLNAKSSSTRRPSYYGRHRVRIDKVATKNGFKGESSSVEFTILRSNNPEVPKDERASWVQNYSKNPEHRDVKEGNFADFLRAAFQTQAIKMNEEFDGQLTDELIELAVGEENIFAGLELDLDVIKTPVVSKPDAFFPKHDWAVPEELLEEAA